MSEFEVLFVGPESPSEARLRSLDQQVARAEVLAAIHHLRADFLELVAALTAGRGRSISVERDGAGVIVSMLIREVAGG